MKDKSVAAVLISLIIILVIPGLYAQDMPMGDLGLPDDYDETIVFVELDLRGDDLVAGTLPSYFNWNDQGMVTTAKDQGYCGSCWAFAAVGAFESKLLVMGESIYDLSEQQQISCNISMFGCDGGNMTSLKFWNYHGPKEENCTGYPSYSGAVAPCYNFDNCEEFPYRTIEYYTVDTNDINSIKASLYNDGPTYFRFNVYSDFITFWNTGTPGDVYIQGSGDKLGGHAVLIIGWDDNKNAWFCKNSWGATAGPNGDGTFWIAFSGHAHDLGFGMANVKVKINDPFFEYAGSVETIFCDAAGWNLGQRYFPMDVDGDGRGDLVMRYGSGVFETWLSNGTTFYSADSIQSPFSDAEGWNVGQRYFPMDVNGDGRGDLVMRDGFGTFFTWLSNGTTFYSAGSVLSPFSDAEGWNVGQRYFPMDVNGDGRGDLVMRDGFGTFFTWLSNGTTFYSAGSVLSPFSDTEGWNVGQRYFPMDVNGDGRGDLVMRDGFGTFFTWSSNGTTFYSAGSVQSPFSDEEGWNVGQRYFPMDVNGDGRGDLVMRYGSGVFDTWLSNGITFYSAGSVQSPFSDEAGWNVGQRYFPMDVDGDGRGDLVMRYGSGVLETWLSSFKPAISITVPKGGENWEVASTYDINWISEGIVGDVMIEYSIDNGSNWVEIVPATGNDGTHPWTIPGTVSDHCLVRVSETDGNPFGISSNVFSIVPIPELDVLSPDGDENWQAGALYNITWSSTGIVGDVKIEYSVDNGANWLEIVPSTPNDGSHPWTIPNTPSDQCRVRISETDGTPYSISNGVFSIDHTPTIQVTTPNWGENLEANSIVNITWHTIGVTGNVNIDYSLDNGTNWINIIFSTANDGKHPWQVPDSPSSNCLVRISETDGTLSDTSDITFSIIPETPLPPVSVSCTASVPDHMEAGQEVQFVGDFSVSGNEGSIVKTDNIIGNMRYIPLTGSKGFIQGAQETDPGHSFSGWEDQFEHVLTKNIAAMETEITRQMWTNLKAVQSSLPDDPSYLPYSFELNQPVQYVSWYKAVLFANVLSLQNGFTPCYYTDSTKTTLIDTTNYDNNNTIYCDFSANGYRLPTEGEWEYFARAGTTTPFWIDEQNFNSSTLYTCTQGDLPALETAAVFCANRGIGTSPAGSKMANPWDLYDVHGNVSEWCWDFFSSSYPTGIITDYSGPGSGTGRCLRGGGFVEDPLRNRSAYRKGTGPGNPNFYYGFRLVRNLSAPTTTYKWSFGDLDYAYERNATHVYSSPSFYGWKLTVTHNSQVCEKTGMIEITPANSISITFPVGGESFEIGNPQEIRWTSEGIFEYVKIEYSTDNGSNWTDINASTENDGSYHWTIPNALSNQCLIRISETDGDPMEISNAFSIIEPIGTIDVTSPDGGEGYEVYTNPVITWTATGTVGNVKIELSTDNGSSWLELVYSTENDGNYIWLVPDQVSNQCLIRISETDGFPSNTSDNVFSILPPGSLIELLSPNGGENWEVGSTQNITWEAPALLSSLIIEYSTDMGTTWKTITSSTPDDGTHPWVIPKVVSNGCLVRIRESDDTPTDTSDAFFSISSPTPFFNVTFPDGGETLTGLSLQNITWTSYNIYGYIKLGYSTDGGSNWTEIAANVIDVGSYAWSVPNGPLPLCFVRVSTMDGTVEDTSESSFNISYTDPRIPEIERLALIDLYNSTNGDNWTNNSGWKEPPLHTDGFAMPGTENSWYGVTVIGNSYVEMLELRENNLTGTLPFSIGNFSYLKRIDFYFNNIGGNIPASIGNLSSLEDLSLPKNQLTGTIPDTIGNLQGLIFLYLNENQLSNGIPSSIGNLTNLQTLVLADNNLGGTIPTEIGNLINLTLLNLGRNSLGGNIPDQLGNLVNLNYIQLYENYLTGNIPASIGNLTNLIHINLNNNSLSGNIPFEIGNLVNLSFMGIRANKLSGDIPTTMTNLTNLNTGNTDIGYNALYTNDDPLRTFLDEKDPDWKDTQTIAPAGVTTAPVSSTSVQVNWTPIFYTADTGGYQVYYSTTAGGSYTLFDTTANKTATSMIVTGLTPETSYCFVVRTRTEAHANNLNKVESENSAEVCDNTPQPASIEVTSPNGGEILTVGTSPGITWSTLGIVGDVKIEYSTTGETGPYTIITAAAANTGTYNGWTVPDQPSANCFIKISEVDGIPTDISNGPFSIVPAPTISGSVTSGGVGLANVVMSGLPGDPVTNAAGVYTAQVTYNWSRTVTPTLAGYTFTEPSTTYSNVTSNQTTNYTASLLTYTISGTITHGGTGLQNVVMNGLPGSSLTDASGFYTAVVNYGWSGTATPTLAGYTFTPPSTTYTNVTSDQTTDYTAELTNQIPISERQALMDLYNSTNGDTWINNSGWQTPPLHTDGFAMPGTEWSWFGVTVETDNYVTKISLGSNNLVGKIPSSIGDLLYLTEIYLYTNQLTGSIPAEITSLQGLEIIDICSTQLSGPLPTDLGNLVNLRFLYLYSNQLSGEIPISIGNCVELIRLYLDDNQLTGKVPIEIGNLTKLERIDLSGNKLQGPIPLTITNLTSLSESFTESGYNAIYTEDDNVRAFMNSKDPDWESTQTIAPPDVSALAISEDSVEINWTPIVYTGNSGMYVVHYGTTPGGPYPNSVTTVDKTVSSITVTKLAPATTYYFVVQTRTEPHENNENTVESDYSEEVSATTLARPALRVTSPNVGENLITGTTYEVTWVSNRVVGDIKIDYSIDNGAAWITIVPAADNSGSYYWTVPDTPSSSCLVRISESDKDNSLSDVSDGGFSIISAPFITVKSPNGRETWVVGSNQQITWTGTGINGNVKIEYSTNNGATWATIAASTENNGIFTWSVPDTPGENCLIRISDIDGASADVSDSVFSIAQPSSITVTSPNGGENWNAGTNHNITWTNNGTVGKVRIDYSKDNGATWTGIATSLDNNGIYPWIVPDNPSDNCLVRISEINVDNGPSDVSNAVFSIIPGPVITIISPNGNENLEAGSVHNITWTSNGAIGEVKLEYSTNNGGTWAVIAASTVNDGSHGWTVPDNPSKSCLIRISEIDGEPADISDAVFSIVSPSTATISIISPNGGESLTINTTWQISWASTGMQANDKVIIEYSIDSGGSWIIIGPSIVNNGSYDWTVPDTPSANSLIRINGSDSDEGPSDVSDAVFSIEPPETPTITVTSPNGGENLIIGSTHNITWTTSGMESVENIIIEYSTDTGTTWTAIVFSTSDIGSFSWTVPDHPADNCLIRIRVSDRDEGPSDISDDVFSIIPGMAITVTSPNGGEQWKTGSTYNIAWTSEGITGDVIIDLYRGDSFDLNISTVPIEQGSFAWNIPGNLAIGDDYKILLHKDTTEDDSDGNFSILDMEPNNPDFNNDGHVDILWRNYVSGNNEVWLMNGPVRSSSSILPVNPDLNWRIVGTGDFNRDGKVDILWRNYTNGQNQVWYMDGSTQTGFEYLTPNPDVNSQIAGTGDFNGNGKIDILWRNPLEGRNQVWHLDGITVTEYKGLPPLEEPAWRIAGIGDFNNDDKADILWRNYVTGSNQVWYMDGTTRTGIIDVPELTDLAWRIAGTGDFNRDGNIDILWRRYADGINMIWYMDGVTRIGYEYIETRSDLNWRIVGNSDYKD
jgi:formylglycine-generating enzyme required for sulfatase activity/Leucine-rich repeat (LRR) protein